MTLDASNITRRLWVGARPPFDRDLPDFDVLVLCAAEIQPERDRIAFSKAVVRAPIPDAVLDRHELSSAILAARRAARALASGQRVLVTCRAGLNRSALVASLALGLVTRIGPAEVSELMRDRRSPEALGNPHFCLLIHRFVGARRETKPA